MEDIHKQIPKEEFFSKMKAMWFLELSKNLWAKLARNSLKQIYQIY
jgi:hypothetical protein